MSVMPAIAATLGLAAAGWVAYCRNGYSLSGSRPRHFRVPTEDGWLIDIHYRPGINRTGSHPVLLCHGLANNHTIFDFEPPCNFALHLSQAGFDTYSIDLRGSGPRPSDILGPLEVNFDDYVERDAPAAIEWICQHAKSQQVMWVGHSLGGLVGLAVAGGALGARISGLMTIGSPVFMRHNRGSASLVALGQALAAWGSVNTRLARYLTPLVGRVAAPPQLQAANIDNLTIGVQQKLLANSVMPMYRGVLAQIGDWIDNDAFRSADLKTDYRHRLRSLTCPTFVVGGTVDNLAPPEPTRAYFDLLPPAHRDLAIFGKATGCSVDYGHGDLLVGIDAPREVYPVLTNFLIRCATGTASTRGAESLRAADPAPFGLTATTTV